MKIVHTSDWHLGHRLHEQSQFEEQQKFLMWLLQFIDNNGIDVLLISGDVFDTGVPSAQAQKQYYDFLVRLTRTNCQQVFITGGNHDAPTTINAPKELLEALHITVVGKAADNVEDEIFKIEVGGEQLIVAAVPYLRDQDIRRAIAAESAEEINNRYKTALVNHYNQIASHCEIMRTPQTPVIAMGHLFAIGGKTSDSEQTIYVGNLGDIGAEDFPAVFDYVALGHLHRAQKFGDKKHIRYSGSPYILSFSEVGFAKKIYVVETKLGKVDDVLEVEVPNFRVIKRIGGSKEYCITELEMLSDVPHELTPWVEVVLDNEENSYSGFIDITQAAENLNLEVLKITLKNERKISSIENLIESAKNIKEFTPHDVFKLKCKEMNVDLNAEPEVLDAFNEILQQALANEME